MAIHSFTGVTGKVTVSGTITGFVSGDFTLATATGKYVTLGNNTATSHTRGLKSWFTNDTELVIEFDADAASTVTYTISGCVLTDLAIEGLEAGSDGALMVNATFEGLTWNRD